MRRDRLAGDHAVARLHGDVKAYCRVDHCIERLASGTESNRRFTDRAHVHGFDHSAAAGFDHPTLRRLRQELTRSGHGPLAVNWPAMNDDEPGPDLETLKAEHRRLDEEIRLLAVDSAADQLELARLKKRKLRLKDQIQLIIDSNIPDIIA